MRNIKANEKSAHRSSGLCASGQLIDFILDNGSYGKSELWTTSCGDIEGSFNGNGAAVTNLILGQLPGSKAAIDEVQRSL